MTTITIPFKFMGEDFFAEVDFTVYDYGAPPSGRGEDYDPGGEPDFSIDAIRLWEERFQQQPFACWYEGPRFEATGELFKVLASSRAIDEAILSALDREASTDDYFSCEEDKYDYSDL